jgi:Ca2+-binding RTX toxin-like protein
MLKRSKPWQDYVPDLDQVIPNAGKDWIPNWDDITNAIPDKGDIADLAPEGQDLYDFLDDLDKWLPDIDAKDYIPKNVRKKLGNLADDIADLMQLGYDNIDVKGQYIDPWTDKVFDYTDFNLVVPKSGKVFTEGSKNDDLMSGHWEKHKYEGAKGNDRIFTWYGKDTLIGGDGNDHLYADGDDCTMIGGKGKDHFYLDGDSTALIKDYRKKGKDIIRVDGYNKGQIKITNKGDNSFIKAGKHTLAKVAGVKKLKKDQLQYSGGKTKTKTIDHDQHDHADHRTIEPTEKDLINQLFTPVADL